MVTALFLKAYNFRDPGQLHRIHRYQSALAESVPSRFVTDVLDGRKLVCFDVGARGGVQGRFRRHRGACRFVLFELDPEESARLERAGFTVVDRIADEHDDRVLDVYVTRRPGCASIFEPPRGTILKLYKSTSRHFEVVGTARQRTVSLKAVCQDLGVHIDYLKLDTQGGELRILKGLGDERPLFIETEVSTIRLYKDQDTFFELGDYLYKLGYMIIELRMFPRRPIVQDARFQTCRRYPAVGMPVAGDACFVPDWTRPEGRALMDGRLKPWAALMMVNGCLEYLALAMEDITASETERIASVLERIH
jgi:FkbM family methyltransferase